MEFTREEIHCGKLYCSHGCRSREGRSVLSERVFFGNDHLAQRYYIVVPLANDDRDLSLACRLGLFRGDVITSSVRQGRRRYHAE